MAPDPLLMIAVSKHKIAGIIVIVVGAIIAVYGGVRAMNRTSSAALIGLAGVVIAVIGILLFNHTIHG